MLKEWQGIHGGLPHRCSAGLGAMGTHDNRGFRLEVVRYDNRQHNLISFNNSSVVDRVTCLFQAHGLSGKQLVKCTQGNARAVAKNRAQQNTVQ